MTLKIACFSPVALRHKWGKLGQRSAILHQRSFIPISLGVRNGVLGWRMSSVVTLLWSHSVGSPFQSSTDNLCCTSLTGGHPGLNSSEGRANPVPRHVNSGARVCLNSSSKPGRELRLSFLFMLEVYCCNQNYSDNIAAAILQIVWMCGS